MFYPQSIRNVIVPTVLVLGLIPCFAQADIHFVETTTTTQGSMAGMPGLPKGAGGPASKRKTTKTRATYIKGGKQASYDESGVLDSVYDYDNGKIIFVQARQRTYVEASMDEYFRKMAEGLEAETKGGKHAKAMKNMDFDMSYKKRKETKKILGRTCQMYDVNTNMKFSHSESGSKRNMQHMQMNNKQKDCFMLNPPAEFKAYQKKQFDYWQNSPLRPAIEKAAKSSPMVPLMMKAFSLADDYPDELRESWKLYSRQQTSMNMDGMMGRSGKKMTAAQKSQMQAMMAAMMPVVETEITTISTNSIPESKFQAPAGFRKLTLEEHFAQ